MGTIVPGVVQALTRAPTGRMKLDGSQESGFSLMEVIVALVIATIAVVGLAYSFGMGRAFINRFEMARSGLGAAQNLMETLTVTPPTDTLLSVGLHQRPFVLEGAVVGMLAWNVVLVGATGTGSDLKQVTTMASWVAGSQRDTVQLTRLMPKQ